MTRRQAATAPAHPGRHAGIGVNAEAGREESRRLRAATAQAQPPLPDTLTLRDR